MSIYHTSYEFSCTHKYCRANLTPYHSVYMANNDGQKETKNTILLTMLTYPTHTYIHTYHVLLVNLTYIHTYMSLVLFHNLYT